MLEFTRDSISVKRLNAMVREIMLTMKVVKSDALRNSLKLALISKNIDQLVLKIKDLEINLNNTIFHVRTAISSSISAAAGGFSFALALFLAIIACCKRPTNVVYIES